MDRKTWGLLVVSLGAKLRLIDMYDQFDWLVQERRNSNANALELRFSCINPSNSWCYMLGMRIGQFDRFDACINILWSISNMSNIIVEIINAINTPPHPSTISCSYWLYASIFHTTHVASFVIPSVRNCDQSWWLYADQEGRFKIIKIDHHISLLKVTKPT